MAFLILLLTFAATIIAVDNCSIPPIFVDFHDRCVDNCYTTQYGLFMGFGTPFQNESLWPSLSHNETTIGSNDFCGASSFAKCNNQTHGIYSSQMSTDFTSLSDYAPLDASDAITQDLATIEETGLVTLNIFTHYFDPSPPELHQIPNYPLTILSNYSSPSSPWFAPAGLLGLGSSSTVLQLLQDVGAIASRSFGLYVGTAYPRAGGAINGSLTLGGYDSGRFTGDAVRYDLSPPAPNVRDPSPYKVQIAKISLKDTTDGNSTTDLSTAPIDAYLTTSQYEMTLPDDITQAFVRATSAVPADSAAAALSGPNITPLTMPLGFEGELTIFLTSGINVTLSTADGTLRNSSNLTPITSPSSDSTTSDGPRVLMLGTSILAHLYLTTNYDSAPPSFHLSPAAQHGKYVITQPLCANDTPEAFVQHPISSFKRNGIIGAILGGVIGGIGLTFAVWWGLRKYFQKKESRRWEERYGEGRQGGRGDYDGDGDGQGMKVLTPYPVAAELSTGGRRARLKGILKPSSHRAGRQTRRLDKGKSPISAYYAEHAGSTPAAPKKSWSTLSDNSAEDDDDDEGQGYDMSQLQGALPPQSLGFQQAPPAAGGQQRQGSSWPEAYPQGPGNLGGGGGGGGGGYNNAASQLSQAALMRERSQSRSRSPSPILSPNDRIPGFEPQFQSQYQYTPPPPPHQRQQRPGREPLSRAFPQPRLHNSSNIPPHSSTGIPPLSQHNNNLHPNPHPPPNHPNHHHSHYRSHSEERRRQQLGLTVNTYFDGPPTAADRVGKKFKPKPTTGTGTGTSNSTSNGNGNSTGYGNGNSTSNGDSKKKEESSKKKEERMKIVRKPVDPEHGTLRRMFPAS